jgi:hypothetical protein
MGTNVPLPDVESKGLSCTSVNGFSDPVSSTTADDSQLPEGSDDDIHDIQCRKRAVAVQAQSSRTKEAWSLQAAEQLEDESGPPLLLVEHDCDTSPRRETPDNALCLEGDDALREEPRRVTIDEDVEEVMSHGTSVSSELAVRPVRSMHNLKRGTTTSVNQLVSAGQTQVMRKNSNEWLHIVKSKTEEKKKEGITRARFVQTPVFKSFVCAIIVLNTLYIGFESQTVIADELSRRDGVTPPKRMWVAGDVIFSVFFTLEMLIRIAADQRYFFIGRDRYWNLFDSIIVFTSILEKAVSVAIDASALRALRVLRIVRLLRVGSTWGPVKAILQNLQCILFSLAGSVESFISAMITNYIVLYIFGLMFMGGVKSYLTTAHADKQREDEIVERMKELYGTVPRTTWTLIAAVSGGYDWMDVAEPILEVGWLYKCYFLFYILFVTVGLLNVLTGTFVNAALQSAAMNREIALEEAISKRDSIVKEVIDLFLEADIDGSGSLTWDEFEDFIQDTKIKGFFMALELDMSSAGTIFNLLDESGDGALDAQEFVQGCIALRGFARKVDISQLAKNQKMLLEKVSNLERAILPECDEDIVQ